MFISTEDLPEPDCIDESQRTYLYVPYENRSEAKFFGAYWCANKKQWYVNDCNKNKNKLITKYATPIIKEKIYLYVPFEFKDDIKIMGGRYDVEARKWFIYDDNKDKYMLIEKYCKQNFTKKLV